MNDNQIFQNNGVFEVHFQDNLAIQVEKLPFSAKADIELDIGLFSRLIVGCCDTEVIGDLPNTHIYTNMEALSKVFYKKPNLITVYF